MAQIRQPRPWLRWKFSCFLEVFPVRSEAVRGYGGLWARASACSAGLSWCGISSPEVRVQGVPIPSELGTKKSVKARFWPCPEPFSETGTTRAEAAQGKPTQNNMSTSTLVYEDRSVKASTTSASGPTQVWGLGVWGWGFGVWGLGVEVWGSGFGVWGLGFGV